MRWFSLCLSIAIIVLYMSPAAAGAFRIAALAYPSEQSASGITLKENGLQKIDLEDSGEWKFSFDNKNNTDTRITVGIKHPPAGAFVTDMVFDIPYFWDDISEHRLYNAAVSQDVSEQGLQAFVADMSTMSKDFDSLVLAHARAEQFWAERFRQLRAQEHLNPNAADVRIAYWLLSTTRDLIVRSFYVPDQITNTATAWSKNLLKTQSYSNRLFNNTTTSAQELGDLVSTIEARDSFFYSKIIQHLNEDLKYSPAKTCARIEYLDAYLTQLDDDSIREINGEFNNFLKVKDANLICQARLVQNSNGNNEVIENAKKAVTQTLEVLRNTKEGGTTRKIREEAKIVKNKVMDLKNLIK